MKRLLEKCCVSVLVLILLPCCTQIRISHILDDVESWLHERPDSALEVLSAMHPEQFKFPRQVAHHALLYSLARDKNYIDVTDDSMARLAVDYYTQKGDATHRMLAWYSLGRVQWNAGNHAGAIVSFTEAERDAEKMDNLHYLGLIDQNIAELYGVCYDWENALAYSYQSARNFTRNGEPRYAAYSQLAMSREHEYFRNFRARDSLRNLVEEYARIHDSYLLSELYRDCAISWTMNLERMSAEQVLELLEKAEGLSPIETTTKEYTIKALAYFKLKKHAAVKENMQLAENTMRTALDSSHLYYGKYLISDLAGNYREANEFLEKAMSIQTRLIYQSENQLISNTLGNYYQEREQKEATRVRNRNVLLFLSGIIALLIVLLLLMLLKSYRQKVKEKELVIQQKEERIQEDMANTEEILEELRRDRADRSAMAGHINRLIQEKMGILAMWSEAYHDVHVEEKVKLKDPYRHLDEDYGKKKEKRREDFMNALEVLRKDEKLFINLEENVNRWKENLMKTFREESLAAKGSGFNETDCRILLLTFAELPDKTAAYLLDSNSGAIRTRRSRLRERMLLSGLPSIERFMRELDRR